MVVCVASFFGVGCTFLDWSIHFLSGKTDFFSTTKGVIPLSVNPVTKINAHGHLKNHPSGLVESLDVIKTLKKQNRLTSFYPCQLYRPRIVEQLGINEMSSEQLDSIRDYQILDYNKILHESHMHGVKIIFASLDTNLSLYHNVSRMVERMPSDNRAAETTATVYQGSYSTMFANSQAIWDSLGLTNIWDLREQQALNAMPVNCTYIPIDFSFPHYWVDSQNLWYNGRKEIPNIVSWLDLPIVSERLAAWIPIYYKWQQIQLDTLQFQYNYKHILECIVNNWSYEIDLTFEQEVVIQQCLIYQYGLNLKTWCLEKFPNNTKNLHKLLEPNIHPV